MIKRLLINNLITFSIIIISIVFFFYSYFFASVVRTIAEDELIKKGFDPVSYVEEIWYSKIIPTISNDSEEITFILDELFSNKESAEEKYGHRSGTGSYSFMVNGEAEIISLNKESRVGTLELYLSKDYDAQIFITIGPGIKKDSVRDADQ